MKLPDNAALLEILYNNPWLTPREKRVFELKYRAGLLNYQIAAEMNCSTETVGRDLKKLYKKLEPVITEYYAAHS